MQLPNYTCLLPIRQQLIINHMRSQLRLTTSLLFHSRDIDKLQDCLLANPNVNLLELLDQSQNTIIHQLAYENHLHLIKMYVKHARDHLRAARPTNKTLYQTDPQQEINNWLNYRNVEGFTSFLYAAYNGHLEVMAFLAETHRVNIAEYTNTGLTALHLAAQNNKVLPFIYLNGKVSLDCVDKDKSTPLHWAAYTKSEQVVAYILSVSTAAIDLQDIEGQTPLMVAVTYGNTRIVRRLLMKGANRYIKNNQHKQALAIAHQSQFFTISKMLNEKFTIVDFVKFYCNIKIEYKPNHRKYVMPAVFLLVCVLCITSINILLVFPKAYSLQIEGAWLGLMLLLYLWLLVPYKLKKGTSYADYMDEKKIKKVCFECKLSRPYRGYHCDICNQCISQYDHHCTWISNCVGKHNIARFICFLFFLLVSLAFIGLVAVLALIEIAIDNHDLYLELLMFRYDLNTTVDVACTAGLLAVDMICSLFVFPVLLLFVVQVKNLLRNKTTYEAMSGKEDTQSAREKLRKHKNQVSLRNCKVMCSNHLSFATTTSSNENTDELITDKFPSEQK